MYAIKFTLKQHTPIIHFQWYEKDATIRPTELKAKLDKWIIAEMTDCHGNADARLQRIKEKADGQFKYPNLYKWLKGAKDTDKTHPALNYSVKVQPIGENIFLDVIEPTVEKGTNSNPVLKKIDFPMFFGNQMKVTGLTKESIQQNEEFWNGKKRIKRLDLHDGVIITIHSPFSDLIDEINQRFPLFILKTNFGTRQGKGYGSFFIQKGTKGFPENHQEWFKGIFDWKFDIEVSGSDEKQRIKNLFEKIDLFYKTLRSGISPQDKQLYFKSMMWKYTKSLNPPRQWDKKTIKQNWFSTIEIAQQSTHSFSNPDEWPLHYTKGVEVKQDDKEVYTHLIWRDLLGLSINQSWRNPYNIDLVKSSQKKDDKNRPVYTRLQSPIFFKPVRTGENSFRVFFEVPNHIKKFFKEGKKTDTVAEILGEWFEFSAKGKTDFSLPLPDSFDFDAFLSLAFKTNIQYWVEDGIYEKRVGRNTFTEPHGKTRKVKIGNSFNIVDNTDYHCLVNIYSQLAIQVHSKEKSKA